VNQAYLGRGEERRLLRLGKLLGEGASGKVYAAEGQPGHAAKLYHNSEEARRYEAKIEAMLAKPPELPPAEHGGAKYPQIAWPTAKLHDRAGCFIGFLMPEVDFARSTSLVNLLQKNSRKLEGISDYYGYRVLVARNLASVFAELHRAGHHMIDLKPANLRFYPAVSWMAVVDADGFSIAGSNGRIGALQLSDEYIAPESWKRKPGELGLGQDLFALAAIIFQLLNNGVHPFAGTVSASAGTDLQTRIVQGHYPYAVAPKPGLMPSTASIHRMFRRATRTMFDAAFLSARRPTAAEWRDHLDQLVAQLTPCAARPAEHVHFGAGCGFCGHEARVDGVRAAPRRPVAQRRPVMASPPMRTVLPLQHVVARGAPIRRRGRQPAMAGFVLSSSIVAALFAGFVLASDQIWQQLVVRRASAATLEIPARSFGDRVTPLDVPLDYLILPPPGAEWLAMREGPGERYAVIGGVDPSQELIGTGSGMATDGTRWMLVTLSDGVSGFVPERSLIERDAVVQPLECPAGKVCVDGAVATTEGMLGSRYRELLGRSDAAGRAVLEAGQRGWEAERIGCNQRPLPAPCRTEATVRRMNALDAFAIGGRL
jgi:hypothetical protein